MCDMRIGFGCCNRAMQGQFSDITKVFLSIHLRGAIEEKGLEEEEGGRAGMGRKGWSDDH